MRKINYIILSILLIVTLSSCQQSQDDRSYNPTFVYNSDYKSESSVESVVQNAYNTVVSIRADISPQSYGMGSGTFIAYDESLDMSFILTCYHVVEGATNYTVTLADQTTNIPALLVGGDPTNDIAILSVSGKYSTATINTAGDLNLGSQIVVIGNPLGTLPGSVTSGYVSYLNRKVLSEEYRTMSLIQTDASINQGNSGGAMFDMQGRLVGVVNAKYVDEGVEGLGFAIPIGTAMDVVNSILETAVYDGSSWSTKGYYIGSYEFAFTLTDYSSLFGSNYIAISGISNNETTSGFNKFELYDEIKTVSYTTSDGASNYVSFNSAAELLEKLYSLNLSIGDKISIEIVRKHANQTIEFEIIQFIPA